MAFGQMNGNPNGNRYDAFPVDLNNCQKIKYYAEGYRPWMNDRKAMFILVAIISLVMFVHRQVFRQ